jgi:hypothetical protein
MAWFWFGLLKGFARFPCLHGRDETRDLVREFYDLMRLWDA